MKRVIAGAVVAIVALVGCSSSGGTEHAASTTSTTTSPPPRIPGVDGRFLSLAGENSLDAGIFELRLWPVRLDPLTPVRRVSSIGACETRVVVAAAQAEVGYSDHIQIFSGGRFGEVEKLGSPHAFKPILAPDCRMLYFDFTESNGNTQDRIHLWNFSEGTDTIIASFPGLGGASWGPAGQIALVERTPSIQGKKQDDVAIHIMNLKNGARRSFPPPAPNLWDLHWSPGNWMAFTHGENGDATTFLQPDTNERHDLAGWAARAWSPDGTRLLVASGGDFRRLGVVELPDFSTVKPLGEAPFPVHDTVWLPVGSDPIGPIAPG